MLSTFSSYAHYLDLYLASLYRLMWWWWGLQIVPFYMGVFDVFINRCTSIGVILILPSVPPSSLPVAHPTATTHSSAASLIVQPLVTATTAAVPTMATTGCSSRAINRADEGAPSSSYLTFASSQQPPPPLTAPPILSKPPPPLLTTDPLSSSSCCSATQSTAVGLIDG